MRFGSLFTGIGGLDLGLERAGMTCAWQVENDPYAKKILEKHWPHVTKFDDIRDVSYPPCVDLIAGGFPCQDISVAGKGAGLAGARSGLWREFHRIINEVRPTWVLIENVPALRTRGLRTVLSDLRASGFDAEWDGLPAQAFGAPHRRDRIFVVAYSMRVRCNTEREVKGRNFQNLDWDASTKALGREDVQHRTGWASNWSAEPDVGRVAHGVPSRVDRLRCLGNAVVPAVAEHVGRLILEAVK